MAQLWISCDLQQPEIVGVLGRALVLTSKDDARMCTIWKSGSVVAGLCALVNPFGVWTADLQTQTPCDNISAK